MSEFQFGDRVWFYRWGGSGDPQPEYLREGLVVGTFVKQELVAAEEGGSAVRTVPRVYVAYAEEPSANSSGGHTEANVTQVPADWVFRSREAAAAWSRDQIDQRVAALMALHARWGEMLSSAED